MFLVFWWHNRNKALPYPCSLDVVSLYTSIPIQEAIDNTINKIEHSTYHLSRHDIAELLNVMLHNMYFKQMGQFVLCLHRNIVYQLMCKACGKFYIGSTIRLLNNRMKEHLTNDNSSVKKTPYNVPSQHPKHWSQDNYTRKRPRQSTTVQSNLHQKTQAGTELL